MLKNPKFKTNLCAFCSRLQVTVILEGQQKIWVCELHHFRWLEKKCQSKTSGTKKGGSHA